MLRLQCIVTLLTTLLTSYTAAQTASTVQGDWIAPALPDTSTTLTLGEKYKLQWTSHLQAWFPQYAQDADVSNVALWITPSDGSVDGETLIASSINVANTYSYTWTVSLTSAQLATTGLWTFRFLAANESYTPGGEQVSSPQVIVQNTPSSSSAAATSTTSAAASKSTLSTTTTPASVASTSTSTSTPASTPAASPNSSSSVSGGEIAGIAIGSVAVVLALGLIAFFVRKHYRQKQKLGSSEPTAYSGHLMSDYKYNPHRSDGSSGITPPEQYSGPNELEGHGYNGPSELDGNRYR